MQITSELGQEIIRRLAEYVDVDINIMNLHGRIVASTDETRINELHDGAVKVIGTSEPLVLNDDNLKEYPGARPGANLPIIQQGRLSGVVGVSGDPAEILRITGLIRASVEIALEQIYTQQQLYYRERQWSNWLHHLLQPGGYEEKKLQEEAAFLLKTDLRSDWRVILFNGTNAQNTLENIRRQITDSGIQLLFLLPFAEDQIVFATAAPFPAVERLADRFTGDTGFIGVGEAAYGMQGIRQSYYQARQALQFNNGRKKVSYSKDWEMERLVSSISPAEYANVCSKYQQRLDKLDRGYIETIDTYFAMNFSVKETAEALHVHRNTLLYRLEQIKNKVGLHPRVFHDAFLLQIIRSSETVNYADAQNNDQSN